MESVGGIKRNETVMQIGMGGGMKAGINIWRSLRDNRDNHMAWRHLNGVPVTGGDGSPAQQYCRVSQFGTFMFMLNHVTTS